MGDYIYYPYSPRFTAVLCQSQWFCHFGDTCNRDVRQGGPPMYGDGICLQPQPTLWLVRAVQQQLLQLDYSLHERLNSYFAVDSLVRISLY